MTTAWKHQERGLALIRERPALGLAWEVGCGKSFPVVRYVAEEKPALTLILAPKSVVPVWPSQFQKHAPGAAMIVASLDRGTVKDKLAVARLRFACAREEAMNLVIVVNYEAAWREPLGSALLATPFDLVVADEGHRIKSVSGKASRWIGRFGDPKRRKRPKRLLLSGTPMPHGPLDLFAECRFLDPFVFGFSYTAFRDRYCVMGGKQVNGRPVMVLGYQRQDELREKFAGLFDVVKKADVLDLPPAVHEERLVELPPAARRVYEQLKRDLIAELDEGGTITAANALVKVTRLQQVASGFAPLEQSAMNEAIGQFQEQHGITAFAVGSKRLDFRAGLATIHHEKQVALAELLEDLPAEEPIAVFCRFRESLERALAAARTAERPTARLDGEANDVGAIWRPRPGEVLAANYASGGVGIDLTAGCVCVLMDQTFNGGDAEQAYGRFHRPGQTRSVTYIHIIARSTVDGAIRKAHERRRDAVGAVLDGIRAGEETTV